MKRKYPRTEIQVTNGFNPTNSVNSSLTNAVNDAVNDVVSNGIGVIFSSSDTHPIQDPQTEIVQIWTATRHHTGALSTCIQEIITSASLNNNEHEAANALANANVYHTSNSLESRFIGTISISDSLLESQISNTHKSKLIYICGNKSTPQEHNALLLRLEQNFNVLNFNALHPPHHGPLWSTAHPSGKTTSQPESQPNVDKLLPFIEEHTEVNEIYHIVAHGFGTRVIAEVIGNYLATDRMPQSVVLLGTPFYTSPKSKSNRNERIDHFNTCMTNTSLNVLVMSGTSDIAIGVNAPPEGSRGLKLLKEVTSDWSCNVKCKVVKGGKSGVLNGRNNEEMRKAIDTIMKFLKGKLDDTDTDDDDDDEKAEEEVELRI